MSTGNPWWGKTLRTIGIVLMSLTAAFTLMGGAGTTCVALNPAGFGGKFAGIARSVAVHLFVQDARRGDLGRATG
jgi:hypothetical protein